MVHAAPKDENRKGDAYEYFVESYVPEQTVSCATTRWGRDTQSTTVMLDHYKI